MKVIDIGIYDGADTAYYLQSGHTVLAIEANPALCAGAAERFARHVQSGALVILNVAISDRESVELTISGQDLGASSIYAEQVAKRFPLGSCRVKGRTLPDIIREHGHANFIKIDIEGADRQCVLSLTRDIAPQWLSFEAPQDISELIWHLKSIGFGGFKAIQQTTFRALQRQNRIVDRAARKIIHLLGYSQPRYVRQRGRLFAVEHSAGPPPWESDGRFRTAEKMITQWDRAKAARQLQGWYDIHAVRE